MQRRRLVSDFVQYNHLARMRGLIDADESGTLATGIGGDYLIRPDVTVGLLMNEGLLYLHAAVSCKWTIRSDRVQNIRHEGVILTSHRRGRQPHVVTVTAEPLPSRLAAIAQGTGEVDAVYHIVLHELVQATKDLGSREQEEHLRQLIDQKRLFDFADLPGALIF